MPETLLTIQEASAITGKSIQTIRRAIKSKKVLTKKRRTPQGFSYLITQDSLNNFYKGSGANLFSQLERDHASLEKAVVQTSKAISTEFATRADLKEIHSTVEELLKEYKKEKESFMRFAKAFQDRFVVLENQLKVLEAPKKKSWLKFWK